MGIELDAVRGFVSELRGARHGRFAGLIDFSYQHYALGDALTTQMNVACLAHDAGCSDIDLYLIIDPIYPAAPSQGFINWDNHAVHLDNLFPAFLCLPALGSIRIVREAIAAELILCSVVASRTPMWPSLSNHLAKRMNYPMDHQIINRFHHHHGHIPHLTAPRGYGRWAREFLTRHWRDRFIVSINPRQSSLAEIPATTYRDSPLDEWHAFIDEANKRYPDVHFLMLGGFREWDMTLIRRRNVSIPRMMGLTLGHELALLRSSDLFMGASSGFATMATFSDVPYVITNMEHVFTSYAGIEVHAQHYPFASPHQQLVWQCEDAVLLMEYLEAAYHQISRRPRAVTA